RTRIAGLVGAVVRAAGGAAQPLRPDLGGARARRERKGQQGHHGRGQQHFPGTHRCLLLVDGRLAVLVRDPHGPDLSDATAKPRRPGGQPAAYLGPSGRKRSVLWGLAARRRRTPTPEQRPRGAKEIPRRGFHTPAGREQRQRVWLLVAGHLAHVEDAVVHAAVRVTHLLGGLLVRRSRAGRVAGIGAAPCLAYPLRPPLDRRGAGGKR